MSFFAKLLTLRLVGDKKVFREDCFWFGTAPFCGGECPDGWKEKERDKSGKNKIGFGNKCWSGTKKLCCVPRNKYGGETFSDCKWFGTAPVCKGECPIGWKEIVDAREIGGYGSKCWDNKDYEEYYGTKKFCCK